MSKSKPHQRNLPVPFFSQRENQYMWERFTSNPPGKKVSLADSSCNVTSLCMIMRYFGLSEDAPDDMMAKIHNYARDADSNDTLGKAIKIANEDFLLGGAKLVRVLREIYKVPDQYEIEHTAGEKNLEYLHKEIAAGYPVWISYGPTWKKPSYSESDRGKGHIAVVRGFTENDDVIINDPWGDVADPYGFLTKGDDTVRRGVYYAGVEDFYYSFASGDNCILRKEEIERILLNYNIKEPVFNQTLVIRYPHYWSFPVRGAGGKILRFDHELENNIMEVRNA